MDNIKEQFDIQAELLELSIKAGRRAVHDFDHLLNQCELSEGDKAFFRERLDMWKKIFYPDDGMKNYRAKLHYDINYLQTQLDVAQKLLREHGIDPEPNLPF